MMTLTQAKGSGGILFLVLACLTMQARAAGTNSAGWSETFEPYSVGTVLQATNGWSSERTGAGVVTNAPASAAPLLSTNIAAVTDVLNNDVRSSSGGVVVVELQVMPTWCDIDPPGDTNQQYALCVKTNQRLAVWQHSLAPVVTNTWLELAASPSINTGEWTRLTVTLNYGNNLFQVQVNGAGPVTDPAGFAADGVTPNGPWFHMVQTNGVMERLILGDGGTNFVDDVIVTNRSVSWSPGGFTESVTNNGTMDQNQPVTVTVKYDTFAGSDGDDLTSHVQVESGLPEGLSLVARRTSATTVQLTLSNAAPAHAASNSVNNLALRFTDGAFTLGQAADIDGYRKTGIPVTFHDTAVLGYSTNLFREATAVNDGSMNNTLPLIITLANDLFTGSDGENYATNAAKLQITGMPAGLTGQVVKVDATHLEMTVLGNALSNASVDSTTLSLAFLGAAFASNTVTGTVSNHSWMVQVEYVDAPVLTYGTNAFVELAANDGAVTGTTVSLLYDTFTGNDGDDLVAAGVVSAPGLPSGLALQAIRTSDSVVTLVFSNRADAHAVADSRLDNVTITFGDGAFAGANAARVEGASRTDLSIIFHDPPVLAMPGGLDFSEAVQNNGTIGNTLVITLAGDVFASDLTGRYAVSNVPSGLSAQLTRDSDTQVTLALTGNASPHAAAQSTSALQVVFADAAFSTVAAANILGSTTNFTVTFADAPNLAYGSTTFNELSFGTMDNLNPMTITLSGDTFTVVPGGDFSAWVTVVNLPAGLGAAFTRTSDSQVSVSLTGIAGAHASSNTIHNLEFTFKQGAFAHVDANQVGGYSRSDLNVVFMDDVSFINTLPYRESFESYPDGFLLAGTNAWTADYYPDAVEVTNGAALMTLLRAYQGAGGTYPITTNHTRALLVRDSVRNEIHSAGQDLVYLDFMMIPVPMEDIVENNTNHQFAFYVNTNRQLVVWHRNTTGGSPVNEWLTLTNNAPLINTNAWNRFTVAQNYSNKMFQIQVNEGVPLSDPAGWDAAGLVRTGSWFHMVNTNASTMSRFLVSGVGSAFVDDLTVVTALPSSFGLGIGTVFKIR